MLKLRTFRDSDAAVIHRWIPNERALRMWSADRYGAWPIRPEDICNQYAGHENSDTLFPLTMEDERGVVGHLIMRFPGEDRKTIRFGFVIVDDDRRREGLGRKLLQMAIRHAVDTFRVNQISLGVFAENGPALRCYERMGFRKIPMEEEEYYDIMGEKWKCLEMAMEV